MAEATKPANRVTGNDQPSGVPKVPTGGAPTRSLKEVLNAHGESIDQIERLFDGLPTSFKRMVLGGLKEKIKRKRG